MASDDELRIRDQIARLAKLGNLPLLRGVGVSGEVQRLQRQLKRLEQDPPPVGDEIWSSVQLARNERRPYTLDYVERLVDDWTELHGDRARADDPADRKSTRLNSSHTDISRMPSSA